MKIGVTADAPVGDVDPLAAVPASLLGVLRKNGVEPIAIPFGQPEQARRLVASVDGLVLKGGIDVNPKRYHQVALATTDTPNDQRDATDLAALADAVDGHKPVLGICRGLQSINIFFGGTLFQDIYHQFPDAGGLMDHTADWDAGYFPTHMVNVEPDSYLARAVGSRIRVNSRHHQAVDRVGEHLRVVARADDGIVEAVESNDGLILGVQWHPEDLWQTDSRQDQLWNAFFNRAGQRVLNH